MSDDRRGKYSGYGHSDEGPVFSAQEARQGDIVLRTRTRRMIFIAGLVGIVILAAVVRFAAG